MNFYDMLSKHYDEIFPFSETTFKFLESYTPKNAKVLDIGCSTGAYVKAFNDTGTSTQGVEINKSFTFHDDNISFHDMNNLPFEENSFDMIYSIGNTVVHAANKQELDELLINIFKLLKPKGTFIMQIVNYDKIFSNNITSLPTIDTDLINFERNYSYDSTETIEFKGKLTDKKENVTLESSVNLTPLTFADIQSLSGRMGANLVRFCGCFEGSRFMRNESFMMIATFSKPEKQLEPAPPSSCSLL